MNKDVRFYDWTLARQNMRSSEPSWQALNGLTLQDWCQRALQRLHLAIQEAGGSNPQLNSSYWHIVLDGQWDHCKRPYYNVWPAMLAMANAELTVDADPVPIAQLVPAFDTTVYRLPLGEQVLFAGDGGDEDLAVSCLRVSVRREPEKSFLIIEAQSKPKSAGPNEPDTRYVLLQEQITVGGTVQDFVARLRVQGEQAQQNVERWVRCLQLLTVIGRFRDDPLVTSPDVLSKDEQKFAVEKNLEYVLRAHRRGKVGWHIGKDLKPPTTESVDVESSCPPGSPAAVPAGTSLPESGAA